MRQQIFEDALKAIRDDIEATWKRLDKDDPKGTLHGLRAHELSVMSVRIDEIAKEALKRP